MQRAAGARTGWGAALELGRVPQRDALDVASPNRARMSNYLLGGKDHYGADREACERLLEVVPSARAVAVAAQQFLLRVTSHLARGHGVRQFIVFGVGLPTAVGVHHVAQSIDARAHVVYADDDPLALVHCRALWEDWRRTVVQRAGPLEAGDLLVDSEVRRVIDMRLPVAVTFVSALHSIPGPVAAARVLEEVVGLLPPGSFLVASHLVSEEALVRRRAEAVLQQAVGGPGGHVWARSEVVSLFGSLRLLMPGLVDVSRWRQSSDRVVAGGSSAWSEYGAVAVVT
ncbi:SAM-dependent methyltransferase [Streptomyces fungicidicus]|uniref:SAM-dependent methyltransferase n=1 Tax=Streptomyces fungicidicus TaxID=68203 RepID=UPI00384DDC8A